MPLDGLRGRERGLKDGRVGKGEIKWREGGRRLVPCTCKTAGRWEYKREGREGKECCIRQL